MPRAHFPHDNVVQLERVRSIRVCVSVSAAGKGGNPRPSLSVTAPAHGGGYTQTRGWADPHDYPPRAHTQGRAAHAQK